MTISEKTARELIYAMLRSPVLLADIANAQDAKNTKTNLLKQWKKLLAEFAVSDGTPDVDAEKLTVGVTATEIAGTYVFELRLKQTGGAIKPRIYRIVEAEKGDTA